MTDQPLIYARLAAVMADCTSVAKRDRNEHQRFMFRGIDAVTNAVGPILRKHGVIVVPDVESVAYEQVQTSTGKPVTSCRLLVNYHWYASDGSSIASRVAGEAFDSGDKSCPKAMSVAFRTALLQSLALPTDEPDPDSHTYESAAPHHDEPPPQPQGPSDDPPLTADQRARMFALFNERGITDKDAQLAGITSVIGRPVTSRGALTRREASLVLDSLTKRPANEETP